ncbi:lipid-A-disaccharide synthase [Agrobacterium sp. SHOUNA12C]|uniref:lipid-A-disaccharide synthase n=1 Tax=Rhizobium rhizogenes TaxID=359 RepID=UPI0004D48EF6|nr:lipid-A-disaccharide synthase [Rhizobium rhizogenes]MCJ9724390.1 lipid-A-disaccharide synthase [Agrobacterium sp. BETTINA12B]MCJ9759289.1 lipid-A-disaccharide synthase [Agrobacterium sp. SHOUNA12C]OCJ06197.1 lipid-A-disaccharide synthase [Agrobacterium sp. 13-626]KEA06893.1 lipid-A-disaccharide synthase [Rhizobium rhizogenes]MQB29553.1 lipid-A-disaccharide synthase [Rhizobium rhizogenes]
MSNRPLKLAVIAGEVSGDLLGGDLVAALKRRYDGPVELIGVGGEALEVQGLRSLFDYSELSIMGFAQVIKQLPKLLARIRQTANAIIAAKPDVLLIIDSPDFTHRVAKKVRAALPDLPVVNYVCPSVWAWKEYRAQKMLAYVDHVLAILPFEPAAMQRLAGPATTYVGHRLTVDPSLVEARRQRALRTVSTADSEKTILLLPGSRSSEIRQLMPVFEQAVMELSRRNDRIRYLLPTVPRQEALVRSLVENWSVKPDVFVGQEAKWKAFAEADAAVAASGTVILELGLAGVPVLSTYKTEWLARFVMSRIKVWTAALPNLIADYVVVPELLNDVLRAGKVARYMERLSNDTLERAAMLEGYDLVWERMQTEEPPGEKAAAILLDVLANKKPGHF